MGSRVDPERGWTLRDFRPSNQVSDPQNAVAVGQKAVFPRVLVGHLGFTQRAVVDDGARLD